MANQTPIGERTVCWCSICGNVAGTVRCVPPGLFGPQKLCQKKNCPGWQVPTCDPRRHPMHPVSMEPLPPDMVEQMKAAFRIAGLVAALQVIASRACRPASIHWPWVTPGWFFGDEA